MESKINKPLVAVKCLVYNHQPYLRQCFDGFAMQKTTFPFIVLVHDDASTDGSALIIKEYTEKYPDIFKPIFEEENQYSKHDGSLDRIVDEALMKSGAKYVAECEGDDYWVDSMKLQKQVDLLESYPSCTISFHRVRFISSNGAKLSNTIPLQKHLRCKKVVSLEDYMNEEFFNGHWTFHTSSFLYRRAMILKRQEYFRTVLKNFPYGDMPMLLSCLLEGNGILCQDEMSCYRTLSGGYNSKLKANPDLAIKHCYMLIQAFRDFDKYTGHKYSKQISRHILRNQLRILDLGHKGFSWFRLYPKFWPLLRLSIFKVWMKELMPNFYSYLKINLRK